MIIRLLLLGGISSVGWLVFLRRNRLPFHIMTLFLLLAAAGVAVIFPRTTNDLANLVGVGRGADLVFYTAIVVVMFILVHYYTKFVELHNQVTQLTREITILRAEVDRVAPPQSTVVDEPITAAVGESPRP